MPEVINVVGAGIAGSLVARLFRSRGAQVRVFDDRDRFSASRASSNLYIDHWLKKFQSEAAKNGVRILEELFKGKIETPFSEGLGYAMKVKHIPQRHLLVKPDVKARVGHISEEEGVNCFHHAKTGHGQFYKGPTVICAGWRAKELIPHPEVDIKVGHCYLFPGQLPPGSGRIALISPFKHEKLYQYDEDTIYYADSVAVKKNSYEKRDQELNRRTLDRAITHLRKVTNIDDNGIVEQDGLCYPPEFRIGYRPITPGHDFGILHRHSENIWSINGGGKNGLVAYADLADKLWNQMNT